MNEHSHIVEVSEADFQHDVLDVSRERPVLVDFWAPWCGPCQSLMPILARLADAYRGAFRLAKVNTDENQQLAVQYGVRSLPTVKLFQDGAPVDGFSGLIPEPEIRALLDRYVTSPATAQLDAAMKAWEEGDRSGAIEMVNQLLLEDPDNDRLRLKLGELLVACDRHDEAAQLYQSLPAERQDQPDARKLLATVRFAQTAAAVSDVDELHRRLAERPDDLDTRYALAAYQLVTGSHEAGLEELITLIRRGGEAREQGREALLLAFDLLGVDHPLVNTYRRKMASALY